MKEDSSGSRSLSPPRPLFLCARKLLLLSPARKVIFPFAGEDFPGGCDSYACGRLSCVGCVGVLCGKLCGGSVVRGYVALLVA